MARTRNGSNVLRLYCRPMVTMMETPIRRPQSLRRGLRRVEFTTGSLIPCLVYGLVSARWCTLGMPEVVVSTAEQMGAHPLGLVEGRSGDGLGRDGLGTVCGWSDPQTTQNKSQTYKERIKQNISKTAQGGPDGLKPAELDALTVGARQMHSVCGA